MVIILGIGAYLLYNRMIHKEEMNYENNANLLFLHEYINQSLMNNESYLKNLKQQENSKQKENPNKV